MTYLRGSFRLLSEDVGLSAEYDLLHIDVSITKSNNQVEAALITEMTMTQS